MHFGNPEAKRRAGENPASTGWKGVPTKSGAGAAEAVGEAGDTGGSSTQLPGATSSLETNGAPLDAVTVSRAAGDSASAAAEEEVGAPAAAAAVPAVPGNDTGAQREGEDDEAFMVSKFRRNQTSTTITVVLPLHE